MVLNRVAGALIVIFGVVTLTFLFIHLIPGDPIEAMLGENVAIADRAAIAAKLGLDKPLWEQYVVFWQQILTFDFGQSIHYDQPVATLIGERIGWTALLAVCSLVCALAIAIPLGVFSALYKATWIDRIAMIFATLGVSIPNFWMGLLLIMVFSFSLNIFPIGGTEGALAVVLPMVTLGTALAAVLSRMLRSSLLETLHEDYVRTAYAKGLAGWQVVFKHAVANAALPLLTLLGLQLGALLGGAVITEVVFSWPGIGQLTIDAISRRDYPVLQVCVMLIAATYVGINTLTDILYQQIDPRIRLERES